jgi:hypothetical protein
VPASEKKTPQSNSDFPPANKKGLQKSRSMSRPVCKEYSPSFSKVINTDIKLPQKISKQG